ncbi:MAG: alcohol dehydrogenase [Pedosphaera sp.]|nr:alcohol dehydrogenase [Pedosphaera sp.]MSU40229.1 alcohol dehydrogenase [Pedosphaera sp.]
MKTLAATLYQMELPEPYSQSKPLIVEEVELRGPDAGEVLVEITGAGLCHSDLSVINGSRPRPMPMLLGHEATGIVRETGRSVNGLVAGDSVLFTFIPMCGHCAYCRGGRPALCENGSRSNFNGTLINGAKKFSSQRGGDLFHHCGVSAFSQFTVTTPESLVKIEPGLPPEIAALFGCAVVTGVGAVMNTAKVQPGETVAVFGLGGVGLSAVMGAAAAGAVTIIAVDRLESKFPLARQAGATHVFQAGTANTTQAIRDITNGGVDYAFECAGSADAMADAYHATRRGGTTVTVGLPHPSRQFSVPAVTITAEERIVRGSYMGSCLPLRDMPKYIELFRAGRLPVDRLFSRSIRLEEINEGFDALARGEVVRQIIRFD